MIKRVLSRAVPQHEWPIWTIPVGIFASFALATLVFYWVFFGSVYAYFQGLAYSPTSNAQRVRVEVGGTLFAIPAYFTRNRASRRNQVLGYVDLHALLPDMTPYREANKGSFLRVDRQSPLVIINLLTMQEGLPASRRFNALYAPYLGGGGELKESGIEAFRFRASSPYARKQIFRALAKGSSAQRAAPPLFLCDLAEAKTPNCEGRFDLGRSAQVSYLFKRAHLADWEKIDNAVKRLVRDFRAATRIQQ